MKILRNFIALAASMFATGSPCQETTVLTGTFTQRACPTPEFYEGSYATLLLDSPIAIDGLGQVQSVELVLDEPYFVRYKDFMERRGSVTCSTLTRSILCGPASERATCSVIRADVAP